MEKICFLFAEGADLYNFLMRFLVQSNGNPSAFSRHFMLLCVVFAAACSSQSYDQDGGDLKRSEVEYIASRLRDATEQEYPLLKHKLITRYVDKLGQSIVSYNPEMPPLPYEFRVLKSNEILAFSLPGGIVYVSLGLLRAVNMEGQLAAAIAHELAHQQLGHQLIMWRRKVNGARGQSYLLNFQGDWKTNFLGERGALFIDPAMEEEADKLAPLILYKAGFDPRVYTSYLQLLHKCELEDTPKVAALLSLHPPLSERLKWGKEGWLKLPPKKESSLSSPTFQQIKAILKETAKLAPKTGKKTLQQKEEP
jgi:predicted Zn-dependent protease